MLYAGVMELVYMHDWGSCALRLGVRVSSPANKKPAFLWLLGFLFAVKGHQTILAIMASISVKANK